MSVTFVNEIEYLHLPIHGADGVQRTYKVMEATAAQSLKIKAIEIAAQRAALAKSATARINLELAMNLRAADMLSEPGLTARQLEKKRRRMRQSFQRAAESQMEKLAGPVGDQQAAELSQQDLHVLVLGAGVLQAMVADGVRGRDLTRAMQAGFRYHLSGASQVEALEVFWGPSGPPVIAGDAA